MADFMTALQAQVNAEALWGVIAGAAVFIGSVVIFAFAFRFVKGLVSGVSKGKAKLK